MAKLYNNLLIPGVNGGLGGKFVNPRTRSGKTIIANSPVFEDKQGYTQTKKLHPAAIREATTYANFAGMQDVYLKKSKEIGVTAYYIAIADWFDGPKVREINVDHWTGKVGQTIHVKARDNVMVARVSVVIRDAHDNVLEMGEAVRSEAGSAWWRYTTKSFVPMTPFPSVEAIAYDLPSNRDSFIIS